MTLFNYVTGRMQPTFSLVHYFGDRPDNIASLNASNLRDESPTRIIYLEIPTPIYKFHEEIFRNGQPGGRRDIDAAIAGERGKYASSS